MIHNAMNQTFAVALKAGPGWFSINGKPPWSCLQGYGERLVHCVVNHRGSNVRNVLERIALKGCLGLTNHRAPSRRLPSAMRRCAITADQPWLTHHEDKEAPMTRCVEIRKCA